jgi:RHS repeat-associated protein
VGNRLTETNGGARTTSTYDAANELTRSQVVAGITTYTFDAAGNSLTSRNPSNQRTTNTWDFENRLIQVALPSAIVDTFTYNADGQRVQKVDSNGTTRHVWDGENILLETDGSNIIQVVYTVQPRLYGSLISQSRGGTVAYYLYDGLGSTTQLANSTGSITDSYLYDSWGNILVANVTTTNWFRYIGQFGYYFDLDTANYYLRARSYAPGWGRFQSRDPVYNNVYAYSLNNPSNKIDPNGLDEPPSEGDPVKPYFPVNKDCEAGCKEAVAQRSKKPPMPPWNKDLTNPGILICAKGTMCACIVPATDRPKSGECNAYDKCIMDHEKTHFDDYPDCP